MLGKVNGSSGGGTGTFTITPEMFNCTQMAVDELEYTTDTILASDSGKTTSHSLGVKPTNILLIAQDPSNTMSQLPSATTNTQVMTTHIICLKHQSTETYGYLIGGKYTSSSSYTTLDHPNYEFVEYYSKYVTARGYATYVK